jgi:hypothetical protein
MTENIKQKKQPTFVSTHQIYQHFQAHGKAGHLIGMLGNGVLRGVGKKNGDVGT